MMSFVLAPDAQNKPNLPNVFTLIFNLSVKLPFFLPGFSLHCEPTVTGDFVKVTKMVHRGK